MTQPLSTAPLLFLFYTLAGQLIAAGCAIGAWEMTGSMAVALTLATFASFLVAHFLNLSTPWRVMNSVLPISIASSLAVSLPSWVFFTPFLALLAIYAPALWTRVPYYPTSRAAYPLILAELPADQHFTFIDIGCGMGDLLLFLQRHRPKGHFVGIEIGVVPYLVSKAKALFYGRGGTSVKFQSVYKTPLADFDFVYAFLSPAAMTQVWAKAHDEMKEGSTFITNSFEVPEKASYQVNIKDHRKGVLFVHRMGEQNDRKRHAS
jgi:SAM-dependent methyltransferase